MAKLDGAQSFDEPGMLQFLEGLDQIHLVAIHKSRPDVHGKYFGTYAETAVEWAKAKNGTGFGIYFTVNRVPENFDKKPKKSDIVAARYCHVDIDPPKSDGGFSKAATLETLDNLRCPPTFVIDSGNGLQAFWALDGDAQNLDAIEGINQQIRTMFSADACFNIDRLMRVPGAVNWPSPTKEARGRSPAIARVLSENTGQVYEPAELSASFPPAEHGRESEVARGHVSITGVEYTTCDELGLTQFNRVRVAIERPKGADRSANVLHAACECVREGYDDTRIAGLLLNPENAVSAHLLDQGDPLRACMRVIGRARGEEPDALVVPDEVRDAVIEVKAKPDIGIPITAPKTDAEWYPMLTPGLKLMVDTVMQGSPKPRLELALGAALGLVATAAGRRYQSPTGLLTNVYLTALMPSGGGKDFPLRAPGKVLALANLDQMVGGRIVSAMGIRSALENYPTMLVPIDEMGKLLSAMANPRGTLKDAVGMLLELYSEAQGFAKGGMYSNTKERATSIIHNPCLSFFGVATPSTFWESLTSSSVSDGFLPRMILLTDNEPRTPPRRDLTKTVWPDRLVAHIKAIAEGVTIEGYKTFPTGDGAVSEPKPYRIAYGDGAADAAWALVMEGEAAFDTKPEQVHPFHNRLAENATKLAMIRAIDRDPGMPVLEVSDYEFGGMLARRSVEAFERQISENMADSEYHAKLKRVQDCIARSGDAGISTAELGRKMSAIHGREREDIIIDLEGQGLVVRTKVEGAGRPKFIFRCV